MNDTVEYYQRLILEKLYNGFMSNPPNRINFIYDVNRVQSSLRISTIPFAINFQLKDYNIAT